MECLICHTDRIRLPAYCREECFHCPREANRPGCHSIQRYCLLCLRQYLQLNRAREDRDAQIKCPLCPATTSPRQWNGSPVYDLDYRMMAEDQGNDWDCLECQIVIGTQNDLHQHVQNECPSRFILCPHCAGMYMMKNQRDHEQTCVGMMSCSLCQERIVVNQKEQHLLTIHNLTRCPHCSHEVCASGIQEHMETHCMRRKIKCPTCHGRVEAASLREHVDQHLVSAYTDANRCVGLLRASHRQIDIILEFLAKDHPQ